MLEGASGVPYALDGRNSSIVSSDTSAEDTGFNVSLHFSVPKLPPPPAMPMPMQAAPPMNTPDARSLFLGYRYDFSKLPVAMSPRIADERVGFFTTSFV